MIFGSLMLLQEIGKYQPAKLKHDFAGDLTWPCILPTTQPADAGIERVRGSTARAVELTEQKKKQNVPWSPNASGAGAVNCQLKAS